MSVISEDIHNICTLQISSMVMYLSAIISTFLFVFYNSLLKGRIKEGLHILLITENTDAEHDTQSTLSLRKRFWFIYIRGFLATSGYFALSVAAIYFKPIDNTQIFGADALFFAVLSAWIFGDKYKLTGILGIILAFLGVLLIIFNDIESLDYVNGLIAGSSAIGSAISFSIIFVMTSIIIRHDTPIRVTFHQCIAGFLFSSIFFLLNLWKNGFYIHSINIETIRISIVLGILYAIATFHFLRAFLFTRPVIIAPLGYSLPIFITFFELFLGKVSFNPANFLPAFLITLGCGLIVREDYKEDKKKMKEKKLESSKPIYHVEHYHIDDIPIALDKESKHENGLKYVFSSLREKFDLGYLDRYKYISQKHEFNKLLLEYSNEIKKTEISSIKIIPDAVIFTFSPLEIQIETDGAARSAPFEILNFGHYEPEDESIIYKLVKNGNTIVDIGANLGWFVLNFAKRFPKSQIYAFEPIPTTYEFLIRNINRNSVKNCTIFNYGLSNNNKEQSFYYFKGGSAIASIQNLIGHKKAIELKCKMKTLDQFISELNIETVDFIKCDVEGSELFVLQGASNTIKKFKPIFFIELCEEWCQKCGYQSSDVINLFKEYGYYFFQVSNHKLKKVESIRAKDEGKYNYFFLHPENHAEQVLRFS